MATFSKRKARILKKMNEITTLFNVEASFLVFPEAGKHHSFAHPSMEDAFGRVKRSLGHEPSGKDDTNIGSLMEDYKKQHNEEINKKWYDLAEELMMAEEKEKELQESKSEWSNIVNEGVSVDELKRAHQAFVELNKRVSAKALQWSGKDGDGSSSALGEHGHCNGGEARAGEQT
ncbi:AGAMOUS-like 57 [Raphanus sativus]|uniref:Agamous-like MADS-box protein AGL23 n=1 Tax=Raphanus sativus TaxID=3726 RepID=A0A6J0LNG0_RAPSA|nr:agamous-like MADS-box protein AGL23 [Raphanus sativus]KAJ4881775.1 AGAMOUS-like 57 [Raphanus sativus]